MFEQKPRFVETFAGYVTDSSVEELKDTDHQHAQQDYMAEQELCDTAIEEFKNYHGRPSFSPKMKKYSGNIAIEAWRFFAGEMILFLKDNNAKKDIIAKWERLSKTVNLGFGEITAGDKSRLRAIQTMYTAKEGA